MNRYLLCLCSSGSSGGIASDMLWTLFITVVLVIFCLDGILLAACGLMLGGKDNLIMFFFACFSSAIVSALIMLIKKADKKTKIPFVPFMIPGFLIMVLLSLG